jgi:hypothetical protein
LFVARIACELAASNVAFQERRCRLEGA